MTRTPTPMPPMENVHRDLRAWARGSHPSEAAVELLIRSALGYRGDVIAGTCGWVDDWAFPDTDRTARYLRVGASALSGGQQRLLAVFAALLGAAPVNLADVLPGLDRQHVALVLAAVSHAAGAHQHSDVRYGPDGEVVGFGKGYLPPLFEWPA